MSTTVYIALGSNLGDRLAHLRHAWQALGDTDGLTPLSASPVYETDPMGPASQPDYLNAVVSLTSTLEPVPLLDRLQAIEAQAGRVRGGVRWGARVLDLDLLLYGERQIRLPSLTVPHPGMAERSFVLRPLADIAPGLIVPGLGAVMSLLDAATDFGIHPFEASL